QQARGNKRPSERIVPQAPLTLQSRSPAPPPPPPPPRSRSRQMPAAQPPQPRRPVPAPFGDEPTRQVEDDLLSALRNAPPARPAPNPRPLGPAGLPRPGVIRARPDDPTRMAHIGSLGHDDIDSLDEETLPSDDYRLTQLVVPQAKDSAFGPIEDHRD